MKVFDWVHRRFLHVHSCSGSLQENGFEKEVRSEADVERHALLEDGGNVFNNWPNGILAIGTLDIGPLEANTCQVLKELDDAYDDNHNEENYFHDVMHYPHAHDDDNYHIEANDGDDFEASPLMKMTLLSHEFDKVISESSKEIEQVAKNCAELKHSTINDAHDDHEKESQMKRRVTLADLFLEDSDHQLVKNFKEMNGPAKNINIIFEKPNFDMKPSSHTKIGLSKAKKLLKEELRPLKKLNQLMRRMMRRKIHPDGVEGKMQKKEIQMQRNKALGIPTNMKPGANDLASLLLIQDSMA